MTQDDDDQCSQARIPQEYLAYTPVTQVTPLSSGHTWSYDPAPVAPDTPLRVTVHAEPFGSAAWQPVEWAPDQISNMCDVVHANATSAFNVFSSDVTYRDLCTQMRLIDAVMMQQRRYIDELQLERARCQCLPVSCEYSAYLQ